MMDKVMLNFVPLNGAELPFLRRGGSGGSGGSAGAGGDYNVESIDNGDGTQTLAITDATGGGASESPFFYIRYEYEIPEAGNVGGVLRELCALYGIDCVIVEDNVAVGQILGTLNLSHKGAALLRCAKSTISVMLDGNRMEVEWDAEIITQQSSALTEITEAEWNAEYNRILNL